MNAMRFIPVALIIGAACAGPDGNTSTVDAPLAHAGIREDGKWTARAPAGGLVRVAPDNGELRVGANRLVIPVEPDMRAPLSVDIVAPHMPMHGVVRLPAQQHDTQWIADVDIPMAGQWTVYVNFDEGEVAAAVHFEVRDSSALHAVHAH